MSPYLTKPIRSYRQALTEHVERVRKTGVIDLAAERDLARLNSPASTAP